MIVRSRELLRARQRAADPLGCLWLLRHRAEQPERRVFVYLGVFPSPRSLGCQAAACFSVRVSFPWGPPLGPCSAEGSQGSSGSLGCPRL